MSARTSIQWDPDAHEAANGWLSYGVFPGGSAGMDSAIQALAGPLAQGARGLACDRWFYARAVDERGPHLRIRLQPPTGRTDAVRRRYERLIGSTLAELRKHAPVRRQPLLPIAREDAAAHHAAYRTGYEREFDRFGGLGGADRAERVFQVSSRMAAGVLPLLAPARSRAGFALSVMEAAIDVAIAPDDQPAFWDGYVRYWIGGDTPLGELRRASLKRQAAALSADLRDAGTALRANAAINDLVKEYLRSLARALELEAEFGRVRPEQVAFDHVHRTSNRIGISPVEETLLATVVLQRLGEALPAPAREPAPRRATAARQSRAGSTEERSDGAKRSRDAHDDGDIAVELRDVSKSYGSFEALRGVSLSVRRGEVFGLVGPNGAGKTSLVECIVGLRVPTSGTIRVLGADPRENRTELLSRIGIQPQEAELFTHLTAEEILDLWCSMFPNSPGVDAILRKVTLEGKASSRIGRLSGGQRQRLVIGLALASDPELLFLDEPGANLDVKAREELHETIRALRDDGRTVVVATHDMEEAETLCDRLAILVSGRVEDCDTPERLVSNWLPEQTVTFRVAARPVREQLERLEGASGVEVTADGSEWSVRVRTMRADELLAAISADDALRPVNGFSVSRRGLVDVVRKAMRGDGDRPPADAGVET
jgi:ABC-2 type transport system ATP-binding protein